MTPGLEPILLDLEKLFLLSDPMENHHFPGKIGKIKFDNFEKIGILKSELFQVTPSKFAHPIAETASPGPVVSVPTQGSWKFDDFLTLRTTTLGLPFSTENSSGNLTENYPKNRSKPSKTPP